jgi:hypothetical protein
LLTNTQAALAVSQEEERGARRHDWTLAVIFLDLEGLEKINDTMLFERVKQEAVSP